MPIADIEECVHSTKRHMFQKILSSLLKIMERYCSVIIGAVTNGKVNPMLMVFSLMLYFDFCLSREDKTFGRTELFKKLGNVH